MTTLEASETIDFSLEKEDIRYAEESFQSPLFSNENQSCNIFSDYSPSYDWKNEGGDFNMNENMNDILASCLTENNLTPSDGEIDIKYEDLENFTDILQLPFDEDIENFDASGLEVASDSGISTADNNLTDIMLSPSSGTISPDSVDTVSDVSSSSDLGSFGSDGGSPNMRNESNFSTSPLQFNINSFDDDVQMKSSNFSSANFLQERNINHKIVTSSPQYIKKINPILNSGMIQNLKLDLNPSTKVITPLQISSSGNSINFKPAVSNSSINDSCNSNNKVTTTTDPLSSFSNISKSTANTNQSGRSPSIVAKVRLDAGKLDTKSSVKCNSPQTIYVTQANKGASSLLKSHTLVRTNGNGRPIFVPFNVNNINQMKKMKTFKIICPSNGNRIGNSNIGTIVSTVRPLSTVSSGAAGGAHKFTTTPTTLFTATSKGSDGRPLIKVTPTACVTPNSHTIEAETPHISVAPSIIKEEPSDDEMLPQSNQELILTEEERRLMRKEGLVLPSRYPLTKQEERDLKRIRRKIRNKISAQDSRKRKKEYVDGLEDRVKNCTDENQQLQKRIKTLEKQNETLKVQLKRYQTLVGNNLNHSKPHNHASTALMMLILSTALIVVPTLRQQDGKGENELSRDGKLPSSVGHSRTLLEMKNTALNMKNLDGFSNSDQEEIDGLDYSNALTDHDYAPFAKKSRLENCVNSDYFSSPKADKSSFSIKNEDPPDSGGLHGIAAMFTAMLDRLGKNWTDSGGSFDNALNLTPHHHNTPDRASSVVVNLNHGKLLRDDFELE